jgi:protein involved in polysaccharide export with SLBB domain
MKKNYLFIVSCLFFCFIYLSGYAQNLNSGSGSSDLSQIKVDQLSDSQIETILDRAQQSGMTMEQLENAALAKGMSAMELSKLRKRIETLQTGKGTKTDSEKFKDRSRTYKVADEKQLSDKKSDVTEKTDLQSEDKSKTVDIFSGLSVKKEQPESRIFGFSLFNRNKLTFEPGLNIPTPSNYQLGQGDEIIIDIWGASQQTYQQKISPEGSIFIDNHGPVYLSGFTVEEATRKLRKELSSIYAGLISGNTFIKVSLGSVRSIKVNLVGEIYVPGTYTISSLSTVFNALYAAGGPSLNGTLRNVRVIRNDKVVAELDFYDFLLNGEQKNNIRLQDQDVVFIPAYFNRVEIKGEIKRPFFYDMQPTESLSDLVRFSGGFTGKAYTQRMKIIRKTGRENKILDMGIQNADTFKLSNGDQVLVDSVLTRFENRVEIKGAVYRPGLFAIDDTLTLKQLIQKAEGLRGDAFKNRVSVYRTMENYMVEVIPVDLNLLMNGGNDIGLKREDLVLIPSIFDIKEEYFINVEGEVRNPGTYPFVTNTTIQDVILRTGGLLESASLARIEVARRIKNLTAETKSNKIAEVFQFDITEDLKISNDARQFVLQPFDEVFIRRSPGYEKQTLVSMEGELLFPGKYSLIHKDERISDLINRSGGLTPDAFAKGARLIRNLPIDAKVRKKTLETIRSQSKDSLKFIVELDTVSAIGINLDRILSAPKSKYDLILQEGDIIKVPKQLQTVRLSGQVLSPVLVRYDHSYKFRRYISNAGGFAPDAKKGKSYIIYANGTIDRTRKFFFFNSFPRVEPGAEIIVPKKAERRGMSTGETIALGTALSSMALIIVTIINATK